MQRFKQLFTSNSDWLNVGLLVLSLALAFALPFSLFLFSYAVLGPLHYITEINWLHQKDYFLRHKYWIWLFVIIGLIISFPPIAHLSWFNLASKPQWFADLVNQIVYWSDILLLSLLLLATSLLFLKKNWQIILFFIASLALSKLITQHVLQSFILVGVFLPTIVHVYVFTFFFMVLGAVNSRTRASYIGLAIMALSPIMIVLVSVDPSFYIFIEPLKALELSQNFRFVNVMAEMFNATENGRIVSMSAIGLKIQTFVAFCYTYHYLNWFGKVSTIGWRKSLTSKKIAIILIIWIGSIALFLYDYSTAYLSLFFMALLHIVLEFPLNVLSIKIVWKKLNT
jgi:hypothetical protein